MKENIFNLKMRKKHNVRFNMSLNNEDKDKIVKIIDGIIIDKIKEKDPNFEKNYDQISALLKNKFFLLSFNPILLFGYIAFSLLSFFAHLETLKSFLAAAFLSFLILNIKNIFVFSYTKKEIKKSFLLISEQKISEKHHNELLNHKIQINDLNATYGDLNYFKNKILFNQEV